MVSVRWEFDQEHQRSRYHDHGRLCHKYDGSSMEIDLSLHPGGEKARSTANGRSATCDRRDPLQLFYQWRDNGVWQAIHDALVGKVRKASGRKEHPSAAILDSQSVKTTEVGGEHGYDAGKKINGRKRDVIVDTLGLILAVVVTPADLQDQDSACFALAQLKNRSRRLSLIWADSAYGRSGLPEWVATTFGWIVQVVLRPVTAEGWIHLPKRWIVERTFGWIGRSRRHSKDYERNPKSSETLILIAMIQIMLRRLT